MLSERQSDFQRHILPADHKLLLCLDRLSVRLGRDESGRNVWNHAYNKVKGYCLETVSNLNLEIMIL